MFYVSLFPTRAVAASTRRFGRHRRTDASFIRSRQQFGAFSSYSIANANQRRQYPHHGQMERRHMAQRDIFKTDRIRAEITSRRFFAAPSSSDPFWAASSASPTPNSISNPSIIDLPDMTGWSVSQVMTASVSLLEDAGVDEPESSVTNLLAHALQLPWESGFRDLQQILDSPPAQSSPPITTSPLSSGSTLSALRHYSLTQEEATRFQSFLQRRLHHEPIQYIVGQWDFMDSTFLIQAPLLCPRPETEELVYLILDDLERNHKSLLLQQRSSSAASSTLRVLDVGCGTGVIGISLAKELLQRKRYSSISVDAIDIDPVAVATSRLNAQRILDPYLSTTKSPEQQKQQKLPQADYHAHLASAQDFPLFHASASARSGYHLVVSNPPYIPPRDMNHLSPTVRLWENEQALCGGTSEDGMDIIRTILSRLPEWCGEGTVVSDDIAIQEESDVPILLAVCWMEVDPSQPPLIKEMLQQWKVSNASVGYHHRVIWEKEVIDFAGRPRFVKVRLERVAR